MCKENIYRFCNIKWLEQDYGAPFVKILYLTDLAQKLLSLCIFSYLCTEIAISAYIKLSMRAFSYLCAHLAISAQS